MQIDPFFRDTFTLSQLYTKKGGKIDKAYLCYVYNQANRFPSCKKNIESVSRA